jgi:hypothetical protein
VTHQGHRDVYAQQLPWQAVKDLPGFDGALVEGSFAKYFGIAEEGPWFYLFRHDPHTRVVRHTHQGGVFHYLIQGSWFVEGQLLLPGWFHYERKGLYWGPVESGDEGSTFLVMYESRPSFIPWQPGVDDWTPPATEGGS